MWRNRSPKNPAKSAVRMAVRAVEDSRRSIGLPVAGVDPSPGALDLPVEHTAVRCSRCRRPAVERCPECGSPLCEGCAAGDEG